MIVSTDAHFPPDGDDVGVGHGLPTVSPIDPVTPFGGFKRTRGRVLGTGGNDVLYGDRADEEGRIGLGFLDDLIEAGDGDDGDELAFDGTGEDALSGGNGDGTISGGAGNDRIGAATEGTESTRERRRPPVGRLPRRHVHGLRRR